MVLDCPKNIFIDEWTSLFLTISHHIETFGLDEIESDPPILEAFIAEANVAV
jgi:hypothetical protein